MKEIIAKRRWSKKNVKQDLCFGEEFCFISNTIKHTPSKKQMPHVKKELPLALVHSDLVPVRDAAETPVKAASPDWLDISEYPGNALVIPAPRIFFLLFHTATLEERKGCILFSVTWWW